MINIDNSECKKKVKHAVMQLRQIVTLRADHKQYNKSIVIIKQDFDGCKKKSTLKDQGVTINFSEIKQEQFNNERDADESSLDSDEKELAEFIQPTTNGKLVDIQYELEVVLEMDDIC